MRLCSNQHNNCRFATVVNPLRRTKYWLSLPSAYIVDLWGNHALNLYEFSQWTGTDVNTLANMTFSRIWDKLGIEPTSPKTNRILAGAVNTVRRRFCPICIRNTGIYELLWQVTDITVCEIHGVELQSTCNECNLPIPYVSEYGKEYGCRNGCEHFINDRMVPLSDASYLEEQRRKYHQWRFLIDKDTELIQPIEGISKLKSLLIILLYIGLNGDATRSGGLVLTKHTVASLRAMGLQGTDTLVVTIKHMLKVINTRGINIEELCQISVPAS